MEYKIEQLKALLEDEAKRHKQAISNHESARARCTELENSLSSLESNLNAALAYRGQLDTERGKVFILISFEKITQREIIIILIYCFYFNYLVYTILSQFNKCVEIRQSLVRHVESGAHHKAPRRTGGDWMRRGKNRK